MTPRVESAANLSERGYVVPQPATGVPGVLDGWVNWDPFERTPELQWPSSVAVFSRMDNEDSRVTSLLEAISLPICGTEWRIDPNGAPDDVVKFVSLNFDVPIVGTDATEADTETEDRFCWSEHLEEVAAPTLQFGHSVFEQVYRRNPDDGMFWIRKLAPRPQWTISKFNVAQDGGLVSITQMPPASTGRVLYGVVPLEIPINRLVVYTHKKKPGQWMGRSILRSAYKHWMLKDELMRIEAATARRNGMGLPVGTAGTNDPKEIKEMRDLAMSARAGMNAGAGLGKDQKLELLGVQGNLPEMRRAIEYHDKQIALSGLAHFLNLGDKGGSYALASVQEGPFVQSVQAKAKTYCRIANRHIVRDLVDINFGRGVRAPRLVFAEIGSRQEATAQALKLLVDAGLLSPDVLVERTLRQSLGLPPRDPKDEAADEASAEDDAPVPEGAATPPAAADAEEPPVAAAKQGRLW